jgi:hypothetical protein
VPPTILDITGSRSSVDRSVRDGEAPGSIPGFPTRLYDVVKDGGFTGEIIQVRFGLLSGPRQAEFIKDEITLTLDLFGVYY